MVLRLIKYIVDSIAHGYELHGIYGWFIHLIGALCSSLKQLFFHFATCPKLKERSITTIEEPTKREDREKSNERTNNSVKFYRELNKMLDDKY